jgi:hypothetical protein
LNGEVVAAERYKVKNGYRYKVTYRYTVDGIERTRTDRDIFPEDGDGLRPDSMVPIVYSVKDPSLARLGTPGHFWGPSQKAQGILLFLALTGLSFVGYFFSQAARQAATHRKLCRDGEIVRAEVVSWERKDGFRGQVTTEVVYRLTLQDGSTTGSASYSTRDEGAVRRVSSGDTIPVLMLDSNLHRPL